MAAWSNSNSDVDYEEITTRQSNAVVPSNDARRSRLKDSGISFGDIQLVDNRSAEAETVGWPGLLRTYQNFAKAGFKGDYGAAMMSQVLVKLLKSREGLQQGEGVIFSLQDKQAECFLDLMAIDNWTTLRPEYEEMLRRRGLKMLVKLARFYDRFPPSLYIEGVDHVGKYNVYGGGFADIYKGTWQGQPVAIKRFRYYSSQSQETQEKFQWTLYREVLVWRSLKHEHILSLYGISNLFESFSCMISPWMENGNMNQYLGKHESSPVLFRRLIHEVAEGLAYIHREGFVHGDLRGANILIDEGHHARLADFGLVVLSDMTQTTSGSGAVRWMAPELHDPAKFGVSRRERTTSTDVYAFAMVCIEVYTRQAPLSEINGDSAVFLAVMDGKRPDRPQNHNHDIEMPIDLWNMVTECWHQLPSSRPSILQVCPNLAKPQNIALVEWLLNTYPRYQVNGTSCLHEAMDVVAKLLECPESCIFISLLLEDRAECFMDILQNAIDHWTMFERDHENLFAPSRQARQILFKLAQSSRRLPSSLFIKCIEPPKRHAIYGGFTGTHRATWRVRPVVVKQFHLVQRQEAQDESQRIFCLIWRSLKHEHIMPLFGVSDLLEPFPCMVVPWMENGNINQYPNKHYKLLSPLIVIRLIREAAEGLAYLHRHDIVHSNLRGSNIIIDEDRRVRLTDFGAAVLDEWSKNSLTTVYPGWMAPELWDTPDFTFATDVYAFAMVCAEVYTRKAPFSDLEKDEVFACIINGERPEQPKGNGDGDKMPNEVWDVVTDCWCTDPAYRPFMSQVCQDLGKVIVVF